MVSMRMTKGGGEGMVSMIIIVFLNEILKKILL